MKTTVESSTFTISSYELVSSIRDLPDTPEAAELTHSQLVAYMPAMLGNAHTLYLKRYTNAITGEEEKWYELPKDLAVFITMPFSAETAHELSQSE